MTSVRAEKIYVYACHLLRVHHFVRRWIQRHRNLLQQWDTFIVFPITFFVEAKSRCILWVHNITTENTASSHIIGTFVRGMMERCWKREQYRHVDITFQEPRERSTTDTASCDSDTFHVPPRTRSATDTAWHNRSFHTGDCKIFRSFIVHWKWQMIV